VNTDAHHLATGKTVIPLLNAQAVPNRTLCTDCGVSRSSHPKNCATACQFIAPDYPALEQRIHGRTRDANKPDETFFGVFDAMWQAALHTPKQGAQWTGITTTLAEQLLRSGTVQAVITVGPAADDPWRPEPLLITDADQMHKARGMRMGYAPLLQLLEPAIAQGIKRLAVIGVACQIYALRALEPQLGLDALYVIGTPCSDNTTTKNFHKFLQLIDPAPHTITYLEFCADYHVELRYQDGHKRRVPFLMLPLSKLPADFFPLTCKTCVDYTNSLSDITVGYMAGQGDQWLVVRNAKGQQMLSSLAGQLKLVAPVSGGKRSGSVMGFKKNTERAAGGLPLRAMPNWLRPIVGWLMPRVGPRGLEFARARVEMKAIESVLHLRRQAPRKIRNMVPDHVWALVKPYGINRSTTEEKTR
jgi:coenzyme F420 hydrogenase subunit beta